MNTPTPLKNNFVAAISTDKRHLLISLFQLRAGGDWGRWINPVWENPGSIRVGHTVLEWSYQRGRAKDRA